MIGTLEALVAGVAVWGPGLEGWESSLPFLSGKASYEARLSPPPAPAILSATERRRTGPVARLALAVAQEATARSGFAPAALRSVFASGNGDSLVVASILEALSAPPAEEGGAGGRVVSPTQFHNSVHNAAAGYWSIATTSAQPATCLGCHDATWPAALLTAMADVASERQPLLLCVYDYAMPAPLDAVRFTIAPFAAGFVLLPLEPGFAETRPARVDSASLARLRVRFVPDPVPPDAGLPLSPALQPLAQGNAAARCLRVLEALARGQADSHSVPYLDGHLAVDVQPCSTAAG